MKIGTRSSPLALKQANIVKNELANYWQMDIKQFDIVAIQTYGDKITGPLTDFGGKGLFTREIDELLLAKKIDIAVHSMKDVPSVLPTGIIIPSVLEREDPRDIWISNNYPLLKDLPSGSKVGTCSLRRGLQLLHMRPDLNIVPIRGNVGTRLQKIQDGYCDGTLLAMAGLNRLGLSNVTGEPLSTSIMLPAVAQGAIGIACLESDTETLNYIAAINHLPSFQCISVERAFLQIFNGSCNIPVAAYAQLELDNMQITGLWGTTDGKIVIKRSDRSSIADGIERAKQLARSILES